VSAESDPVVVDLGAVGRASVALARWYQGLVATGEADVDELGQARAELAVLPVQPGRLGRAVQLVVAGGDDASDEEIVAAVSLLCDAAARAAQAAPTTPPAQVPRPSPLAHRRRGVIQPTLPGLDPGEPPGGPAPGSRAAALHVQRD
jgi:hypothetical protein